MHKRKLVSETRISVSGTEKNEPAELQILIMVLNISVQLQENPLIAREGKKKLWIYYENSCIPCEMLIEELGETMASASRTYPVSLYGNTSKMETAKITAGFDDKTSLIIRKYAASGCDFSQLVGVGMRLEFDHTEQRELLYEILREIRCDCNSLAYPRKNSLEKIFGSSPQLSEDTYLRYIPLDSDESLTQAIASLPLRWKKRLWLLLVKDDVSVLEFEYLLDAYEKQHLPDVFSWDLALRLALREADVLVSYENNDFRMVREEKTRLQYNYETGTAAQRFLLKLLFPVAMR